MSNRPNVKSFFQRITDSISNLIPLKSGNQNANEQKYQAGDRRSSSDKLPSYGQSVAKRPRLHHDLLYMSNTRIATSEQPQTNSLLNNYFSDTTSEKSDNSNASISTSGVSSLNPKSTKSDFNYSNLRSLKFYSNDNKRIGTIPNTYLSNSTRKILNNLDKFTTPVTAMDSIRGIAKTRSYLDKAVKYSPYARNAPPTKPRPKIPLQAVTVTASSTSNFGPIRTPKRSQRPKKIGYFENNVDLDAYDTEGMFPMLESMQNTNPRAQMRSVSINTDESQIQLSRQSPSDILSFTFRAPKSIEEELDEENKPEPYNMTPIANRNKNIPLKIATKNTFWRCETCFSENDVDSKVCSHCANISKKNMVKSDTIILDNDYIASLKNVVKSNLKKEVIDDNGFKLFAPNNELSNSFQLAFNAEAIKTTDADSGEKSFALVSPNMMHKTEDTINFIIPKAPEQGNDLLFGNVSKARMGSINNFVLESKSEAPRFEMPKLSYTSSSFSTTESITTSTVFCGLHNTKPPFSFSSNLTTEKPKETASDMLSFRLKVSPVVISQSSKVSESKIPQFGTLPTDFFGSTIDKAPMFSESKVIPETSKPALFMSSSQQLNFSDAINRNTPSFLATTTADDSGNVALFGSSNQPLLSDVIKSSSLVATTPVESSITSLFGSSSQQPLFSDAIKTPSFSPSNTVESNKSTLFGSSSQSSIFSDSNKPLLFGASNNDNAKPFSFSSNSGTEHTDKPYQLTALQNTDKPVNLLPPATTNASLFAFSSNSGSGTGVKSFGQTTSVSGQTSPFQFNASSGVAPMFNGVSTTPFPFGASSSTVAPMGFGGVPVITATQPNNVIPSLPNGSVNPAGFGQSNQDNLFSVTNSTVTGSNRRVLKCHRRKK